MQGLRQFELLEDLQPHETARAVLMKFNGSNYVRSDEVVELHDFIGSHGERSDRGYAFKSEESGHWEVASGLMQPVPLNRW
jgi:hypothetical protein